MNGSEPRYSREYVEIMTSIENVRTRLEALDGVLRTIEKRLDLFETQCNDNRMAIANIRGAAVILGGLAGSAVAAVMRLLFDRLA